MQTNYACYPGLVGNGLAQGRTESGLSSVCKIRHPADFFHPTNIVQFRDPLHDGKSRTHGGKLTAMYRRGLSSPLRRGPGISAPAKMIIFVGDRPAGWFIATG